ncbi:putative NRPS-like protein biosynthetic cluster [Psilocybe cubensis]|uniref:NRPS-like protein biosynthetic cluster n=2 Tax=Psilocybe cubensis TaxID=181762 RepID=A0ACB8HI09_PSICU|nr:putative NRPS-like protein biosynthetic cluster [Psilocybe cubensis]KAH9487379.1 putative NRPS-like protein biosynthetic cluster [Psilocybe cubensis]
MESTGPTTITELLALRAKTSSSTINFLGESGDVTCSYTFQQLVDSAQRIARALLSSGLRGGGKDIVVSKFDDQRLHILVFWGCAFAGIPYCPLPPFHPDESRQSLLLNHLQNLFGSPTFISDAAALEVVQRLVPESRTIDVELILNMTSFDASLDAQIYPTRTSSANEIVALMLTSGSTGNSKGVMLPHSMVLAAIRGKALKHGTKDSDIFLNWINFDHVANVTEAHLHAIWAGASQYQVNPSAIIRKPRNLLDWCSRYHVTHTFSPNFLLAQICRDATLSAASIESAGQPGPDLSALRVMVTGGEANPVTTAVEFSDIIERFGAPRTTLRAAFGMTETGAGIIYNNLPILKNVADYKGATYLSIGTSHVGGNVRVMDPVTSLPCPQGVVGQLQMSGPAIFTQYYSNPTATNESFTSDGWFITGDLALIDDDGNVHMLGRHKDVINVNGVKHPCVDIEHYIADSNIDNVEISCIFACALRLPGADTETYTIFYQHNGVSIEEDTITSLTDEQLESVLDTNQRIRNLCAAFCSQAPHVILPLPRNFFFKTALGKVSRITLAKAYGDNKFAVIEKRIGEASARRQEARAASSAPQSELEKVVCEGVSIVFEVELETVNLSQNIFDMGASSMHLIRLKTFLQDHFGIVNIPTIELLQRPIVSEISTYVQQLVNQGNDHQAPYNPLLCLNPQGSKPPIYLVHPGVGEVLIFINLARILNDDRPVYALRARGFEAGETPPSSMQEMVDIYADAIVKNNPSGPYYLAGYSFGAGIAFEIGKLLEKRGKVVPWLGVMNLPPFIQFRVKELVWVETLLNLSMFLALIRSEDFEHFKTALLLQNPGGDSDLEPANSRQLIEWTFAHCNQERLAELNMPIEYFHRWVNVAYDVSFTGRTYVPSGCVESALTTVFCAIPLPSMGTREEYKRDRLSKWKDYSGKNFEMIDVDGEHYTMISEIHVESFAAKMRDALHRAELLQLPPPAPALPSRQNFDSVPIIDFSLSRSNPTDYFKQLKFALEDVGFGIFVNVPGFEQSFQDEVLQLAAQFFQQPEEWKASLATDNSPSLRGHFRCDKIEGPHKAYAEAYRFGAERPAHDSPDVPFWLRIHEGPNQWPKDADLPGFRAKLEALFERYRVLNVDLNKHIAALLEVPYSVIDDYFPSPHEFNAALWHYLPLTPEMKASEREGFVNGMHEHRDPSTFLTCLIQSRPGLQVQNHSGQWIDIPMVEGGVVCNVGMQFMRLTGGKLVATTHRVNTLKIDNDRYTIPYVLTTKLEKPVVPLPQFDNPSLVKVHVAPNSKVQALMAIEDPLIRSGYARLSLFPAAAQKMYPKEWEEAKKLGIV